MDSVRTCASILGVAVAAALMWPAQAKADAITGTFSASPASTAATPVDLTNGGQNLDWIQFEGGSTGGGAGSTITGGPTKPAGSNFNGLVAPEGGYPSGYFGASTPYNAGTSDLYLSYPVSSSTVVSQKYAATREHSNGNGADIGGSNQAWEVLTLTLTQPEETVALYLDTYNASAIYSAYLSNTGEVTSGTPLFSAGAQGQAGGPNTGVLPDGTTWDGTTSGNQAGLHSGVLTLDVSGSVGETLTFTAQQSGNTGTGYPNIGIAAATAAAAPTQVPEPASLGVMGIGALALMRRRRAAR